MRHLTDLSQMSEEEILDEIESMEYLIREYPRGYQRPERAYYLKTLQEELRLRKATNV